MPHPRPALERALSATQDLARGEQSKDASH